MCNVCSQKKIVGFQKKFASLYVVNLEDLQQTNEVRVKGENSVGNLYKKG